ncbi:MAG: hypothetical protein JKY52_08400 [Flavobacteriales bacterium]|nr:hypothetical protein [Flavobacteriales bacterium]
MYDITTTSSVQIDGKALTYKNSREERYKLMAIERFKKRTVRSLMREASKIYDVSVEEIKCPSRIQKFVGPRHWVMYHASRIGRASISEIGRILGGRSHATVIYGSEAHAVRHDLKSVLFVNNPCRSRKKFSKLKYAGPEPRLPQCPSF